MKRIMVVDDTPDTLKMFEIIIEEYKPHCELIAINRSKECIDYFNKNHPPDIIFLDIVMPELDGWQLYQMISKHPVWKDITIILMTANTEEYRKIKKHEQEINIIEKPFDIVEILDNLEK